MYSKALICVLHISNSLSPISVGSTERLGSFTCSKLARTVTFTLKGCHFELELTMSTEQLRRAEENRQKALAKRRAAQQSLPPATHSSNAVGRPAAYSKTNERLVQGSAVAGHAHPTSGQMSIGNWVGKPGRILPVSAAPSRSFSTSTHSQKKKKYRPQHNKSQGRVESSKATCQMISKTRFTVAYHPGDQESVMKVFHSLPSRKYDSATCRWSFSLSDHDALVKAFRAIQTMELNSIPRDVLLRLLSSPYHMSATPPDIGHLGPTLLGALFAFQKEGVEFAISRRGRILLADEMGLGKTVQAIAIAAYYRNEWPVLVVSPTSVQYMWSKSFLSWIPSLKEEDINVVRKSTDDCSKGLITIMSYGLASRTAANLFQCRFQVVIADESHFLKNMRTQRAKALLPVLHRASRAILLTGTPALSRPVELFSQVLAVDRNILPKFMPFALRYCDARETTFGWDYSGNSNLMELQALLESTVMLRRLKKDVMGQLPDKSRQLILLDPSLLQSRKKTAKLSEKVQAAMKADKDKSREMLLQLYSVSAQAKLNAAKQFVKEKLESSDEKLVVFAHHHTMMDGICESLGSEKVEYIRIDGHTASKKREDMCAKFQEEPSCRIAVLSLTAAGVGITLTAASTVVFTELYWNPGALIQAEDRVYRIGQTKNVSILYLVAQKTVDDYIWPMVKDKLSILNDCGIGLGSFNDIDTTKLKKDDPEDKQPDLFKFWADVLEECDGMELLGGTAEKGTEETPLPTEQNAVQECVSVAEALSDEDDVLIDSDDELAVAAGSVCRLPSIDLDAELNDLQDMSAEDWLDDDLLYDGERAEQSSEHGEFIASNSVVSEKHSPEQELQPPAKRKFKVPYKMADKL